MRIEVIREMLHDPNFDPTVWLDKALVDYIMSHKEELVQDKTALQYIIRGMEDREIDDIAGYIARTGNTDSIADFCDVLRKEADRFSPGQLGDAVNRIIAFAPIESRGQIVGWLVKIKRIKTDPSTIMPQLSNEQAATMLTNWIPVWNLKVWKTVLQHIGPIDLFPAISTSSFLSAISQEAPDHREIKYGANRESDWPAEMQDIIVQIIDRIHDDHLPQLVGWLRNITFEGIYSKKQFKWLAKKLKEDKLDAVKLDDKVCRCGFVAASPSGITLHLQRAEKAPNTHERCTKMQVGVALKVKLARSTKFSYLGGNTCGKCGGVSTRIHEMNCTQSRNIE